MVATMKTTLLLLATIMTTVFSTHAAGSLYDIPLKDIDGKDASLKPYAGKVLLLVNVASHCGFTPQYAVSKSPTKNTAPKDWSSAVFRAISLAGRNPGTDAEIKQFCTAKYNVTFPMFDKLEVNGNNRHPLYALLAGAESPFPGNIKWNFTKFLDQSRRQNRGPF